MLPIPRHRSDTSHAGTYLVPARLLFTYLHTRRRVYMLRFYFFPFHRWYLNSLINLWITLRLFMVFIPDMAPL
jgi:hypothetical protein